MEWADRVTELGYRAFSELPENKLNKLVAIRFRQGCIDKKAGHFVANLNLATVDEAMDRIQLYQYQTLVMYGTEPSVENNSQDSTKTVNTVLTTDIATGYSMVQFLIQFRCKIQRG